MMWGYMLFKQPRKIVIINSTINVHVNIEILDNLLILSMENWFGDEVSFQDQNVYCYKAKGIKAFLWERRIKINDIANNPDLNQTENFWWNFFFEMVHEKALSLKEDL